MLKVAIVGCGKIADEHARQIRRVPGSRLVAFYDAEPLMAKQMEDRFEGTTAFDDLDRLLSDARPDVVHITTPPQSHYSTAMRCLDAGCHAFIEKPFTIDTLEAARVIGAAVARNLNVTVGHNYQFSDPAVRLRELVDGGYLGGPPVHIESYYCYDLSDSTYAKAFLDDTSHWVRSLPGGLLQNIISHGICRIAEYMHSECPEVIAQGFTSPLLRSLGEHHLVDELRVLVRDEATTAFFTFSSQMRPQTAGLRLFGPRNGLLLDDNHHTLVRLEGRKYRSYLDHFIPPAKLSRQLMANSIANMRQFVRGRLNMNEGMRELIARFYQSIAGERPLPIPYREILLTSRIMDAILDQVSRADQRKHADRPLECLQ
jgi:predicted dehydrogenase